MPQQILSHAFANGLVLVAEPMQSVESAAFSLRIPAGYVHEPDDRAGLGVMTSELVLRGAGPRDSRAFVEQLDNLGVERGESVTDAHIAFSGATLARNLRPALECYADVVRRAHLPEHELEPTRGMALQELAAVEDEPSQKVMQELRRRFYPGPWGRSSQGSEPGLTAVTLSDVQAYYRRHFRPNGAILGVAGRIDWKSLVDDVGTLFGDWKVVDATEPVDGTPLIDRAHLNHESNQTQVAVAYSAVPYAHADYFQAWAGVGALSGGMSARLFTEVREKRGLCYSVFASYHTLPRQGGVFCYAGTTAARAQETLDVLLGELVRLRQGIESHELDRLKARIKSGLIMQQESTGARASSIARDWYYLGRVRTLDEVGAIVDGLTTRSINAYLAEHPPRDFTVVTLGPAPLEVNVAVS